MKSFTTGIIFRLFLLALLGGGVWLWFALSPVRHAPGMLIRNEPLQVRGEPVPLDPVGEYALHRLAGFHIDARVLSVERPRDAHVLLSPIDIVVGWGPMSDSAILDRVKVEHRERLYRWQAGEVPEKTIRENSAQLHLIIGTPEAGVFIGQIRPGSLISLRGSLVEARRGDFHWRSALLGEENGSGTGVLFHVTHARAFEGNHELSLHRWYTLLVEQREALDLNNPDAVRAFNREARRYMEAAHPAPAPSPTPSPAP